ncbi:MAG: helix-turn-helix transcriptional regulator [Prevotella sp.]
MKVILTFVFVLVAVWHVSRKEIGDGIMMVPIGSVVRRKMQTPLILACLAIAGTIAVMAGEPYTLGTEGTDIVTVTTVIVVLVLMSCLGLRSSVITVALGAWMASGMIHHDACVRQMAVATALAIAVSPLLTAIIAFGVARMTRRYLDSAGCHILIRNMRVHQAAVMAVMVCAPALAVNYGLATVFLARPILASHPSMAYIAAVAGISVAAVALMSSRQRRTKAETLPALHTLVATGTVMAAVNAIPVLTGLTAAPVVVSSILLSEAGMLATSAKDSRKHMASILTLAVLCPGMAFGLFFLLHTLSQEPLLAAVTVCLVILVGLQTRLQRHHGQQRTMMVRTIDEERRHKSEMDQELNRLDVVEVTSQFNNISNEIDLKQKTLINLSLYIRQQREYMAEIEKAISDATRCESLGEMRTRVTEISKALAENLRLSEQMDQFYTQVEELHKNFVCRLQMRCPGLTDRERRLAILLRLGLTSKEIATLMNVETKSVEISRYRFRKKLKLDRQENIVQYLQML